MPKPLPNFYNLARHSPSLLNLMPFTTIPDFNQMKLPERGGSALIGIKKLIWRLKAASAIGLWSRMPSLPGRHAVFRLWHITEVLPASRDFRFGAFNGHQNHGSWLSPVTATQGKRAGQDESNSRPTLANTSLGGGDGRQNPYHDPGF